MRTDRVAAADPSHSRQSVDPVDGDAVAAARSEVSGTRLRVALNGGNTLVARRLEDGSYDGPGAELVERIARALDLVPEFLGYEGAAAAIAADPGDGWHVGLVAPDPARAGTLVFTPPYMQLHAALRVAVRAGIDSIADVDRPGVEVASVEGAAFYGRLRRLLRSARVVGCRTPAAAVAMVLSGEAVGAAGIRGLLETPGDREVPTMVLADDFAVMAQAVAVPVRFPALARVCGLKVARFLAVHPLSGSLDGD